MTFHERKQARKEHYENNVKGWKLRPCSACNGSGYYDHNDSPECCACDGSGKERFNPIKEEREMIKWILRVGSDNWTRRWWSSHKETKRGLELLKTEAGQEIERLFYLKNQSK